MHCLWGLHAGERVSVPPNLFPQESSLCSLLRCGCGLHFPHHEINVNAGFLLATPRVCYAQRSARSRPVPRLSAPRGRTFALVSKFIFIKISKLKRTPAASSSGPRSALVGVHVGASACAHTRESRSPVRPLLAALVATLAVLGRLRERHMKDFIEFAEECGNVEALCQTFLKWGQVTFSQRGKATTTTKKSGGEGGKRHCCSRFPLLKPTVRERGGRASAGGAGPGGGSGRSSLRGWDVPDASFAAGPRAGLEREGEGDVGGEDWAAAGCSPATCVALDLAHTPGQTLGALSSAFKESFEKSAKIVDRDAFGQRLCNRCGVCVEDFASGREEEGSTRSSGGDSAGGVSRRHQGYASRQRGRSIQSSGCESP
ncbi:uncharacterized protein [Marmota flaviventris]|uniref:uncharacterized protein n=1 Tax=Marmota flaviventris TaxID=93162 RepID=UPI003A8364EA